MRRLGPAPELGRCLAAALLALSISAPAETPQATAPAWQPSAKDGGRLIGLWGCDHSFGPEVRGQLTIVKRGAEWSASIGGYTAAVEENGGAVSFTLPGDRGGFRGRLRRDSQAIDGHWIQARGVVARNGYASPLQLRAENGAAKGVRAWRGEVVPLEDAISIYLSIDHPSNGGLRAFFRNPERNFGRAAVYGVSLDGERVRLNDPKTNQVRFEGSYDPSTDRITFRFESFGGHAFEFARRGRDQARGFFPRTPAVAHYQYQPPLDAGDGWSSASLLEVGLDPAPISELVQRLLDADPSEPRFPLVQGLLIARHGKLVLEEYFYGFSPDRPHDLRSAGKSFTTTLVGTAIEHGAKFGVGTPVLSLFPEYRELANPDPRKGQITVEHLLTMSTGLACDDDDDNSPGNEDRMYEQKTQPDFYKYTLDLPMAHQPGEVAAYCSATINLLGGVLRNATGQWIPDLLHQHIGVPLNFQRYYLNLSPTGEGYMGGGAHLRPRDAIKLGQLFLGGGVWNGRRVVSERWVMAATQVHSRLNNGGVDGYNWWLQDLRVGERSIRTYSASGNGGQRIIVVPQLDMVVMFTGGNYSDFSMWRKFIEEFLPQYILPAALRH